MPLLVIWLDAGMDTQLLERLRVHSKMGLRKSDNPCAPAYLVSYPSFDAECSVP